MWERLLEKKEGWERFLRKKGCQVLWVEGVREMFLRVMGGPDRREGLRGKLLVLRRAWGSLPKQERVQERFIRERKVWERFLRESQGPKT